MKQILSAVLFISIIFFSCQKEFNERNGSNAPGSNTRGPKGPKTNSPPVANAGPDQTIILPTNTAALNGSASTDPNNNISGYLWRKISGPSSFTIANANAVQTQVTNLIAGVYKFELKVTDAGGLFDKDTVQVTTVMMNLPPPCTTCKIVFVSARDGNNEIYTSNTDGSNIIRLTNDPDDDGQPKWSPDGTRIAFTSDRGGSRGLYIMNADGSSVVLRTFSVDTYAIRGLTWSPDGTKIAYSDNGAIYVVGATSGSPVLLSAQTGYDFNPAWSPDGTKIALSGGFFDGSAEGFDYQGIYTINPEDGTGSGVLTPIYYYANANFPSWSPNGAKLAVVYSAWSIIPHVCVMNSDGSGFTLLMPGEAWAGTSWSSDGTAIVYTSSSGNVSWVAADGSAGGTIVTNGWDADWKH